MTGVDCSTGLQVYTYFLELFGVDLCVCLISFQLSPPTHFHTFHQCPPLCIKILQKLFEDPSTHYINSSLVAMQKCGLMWIFAKW